MERTLSVVEAESIAVRGCIATTRPCKKAEGFQTDVRVGVATPSIVAYVSDGVSSVSASVRIAISSELGHGSLRYGLG